MNESIGALPGCQPYHSLVNTPTGWVQMGDLQIGDYVTAADGSSVKILNIYKKGVKAVYKVTTTEGKVTECCADHIWSTRTAEEKKRGKPFQLRTTAQIMETINDNKINPGLHNHYLPQNKLVEYVNTELPLPAYTLGALLGDGYLGDSVSIASTDPEIVDRVADEIRPLGYKLHNSGKNILYTISRDVYKPNKVSRQVSIKSLETGETRVYTSVGVAHADLKGVLTKNKDLDYKALQGRVYRQTTLEGHSYSYSDNSDTYSNTIKQRLYELGLLYKTAEHKHIPKEYLYTGIQNRVDLLRGLLDTDGTIKKSTGEVSFTTVSPQLSKDVQELVRSLGGKCTMYTRDRRGNTSYVNGMPVIAKQISYELCINLHMNPFYLSRKAKYWHAGYAHSDGIKTIEYLYDREVQCLLIDHPDHLYLTNEFIVTHNTVDEKLYYAIAPILDNLELICSTAQITKMVEAKTIEVIPVSHLRGRSLSNTFVIVEEAQNLMDRALLTILTRLGLGSRMVFTADPLQADFRGRNGTVFLERVLEDIDQCCVIKMPPSEIYRHPLLPALLKRADQLNVNI
jgi:intein/homing endonuclease